MASGVKVTITDRSVISALNTPGGAVNKWRDKVTGEIQDRATLKSPKNNPMNARHRGGVVGTYREGWRWKRSGNGHRLNGTVFNLADHAWYVEFGRSESHKWQVFSWKAWNGETHSVGGPRITRDGNVIFGDRGRKTAARPGKHILRNATNYVMARETSSYTPLA